MARQLTFDLPVRESRKRGDFFVSDANALAVARLDDTDTWPNRKLVLVGPQGAGKTHLAHVWAEQNNGTTGTVGWLLSSDIPDLDHAVVLEVPEQMDAAEEEALFHFHNHMQSNQLPMLLVARTPPAQWDLKLPDLKSRMEATDTVRIYPPDDALLSAVMVKLFADRQLNVAPPVIDWLIRNMDRSFASAQTIVAALDQEALAEGRAVTRPLAQKVLSDLQGD